MPLSDFGLNPYVDRRTGAYHNLVGARSSEELKQREDGLTNLRITELRREPVQGKLDFDHLKEIHRRVFQDVYAWAGQVRQHFNAAKQDYVGGPAHAFTPSPQIESEGRRISRELTSRNHLQGLSKAEFVTQLTRLHGELNQLHPFPEGNGRTQRLFLEQVSHRAGHPVDLSIGTEERIIQASIAQTKGQHALMERFIAEAADPDRVRAMRAALEHLNQAWGRENTSRTYIAATVPGQEYSGALYSKAGRDFILRTDDRKLVIGYSVDLPAHAAGGDRLQFTATDGVSQQLKQTGSGLGRGLGID